MTGEKIVRCSDQTLHDLSGKATYLESVAVFEDKIVERVCTAIRDVKRFPPEALSLKTYVYVHILNDIPGDFNEEICYELFFYPNSALTSLCMLGMGEANAEKIEAAVREFFGEHPDTTLTLKKVFYQMFVVFRHAVTNGYLAAAWMPARPQRFHCHATTSSNAKEPGPALGIGLSGTGLSPPGKQKGLHQHVLLSQFMWHRHYGTGTRRYSRWIHAGEGSSTCPHLTR